MGSALPDRRPDTDHVVQFYEEDASLIAEVGRAMCVAIDQGNAVVCIATEAHRRLLENHLSARGINVPDARMADQIVSLDAVGTLARITRNESPDVVRFAETVGAVVDRVSARYPRVWIFGELVALMCANGHHSGAVELEQLWTSFMAARPNVFLHCAYPVSAFTSSEDREAFLRICDEHCRILHSDGSLAIGHRAEAD